MFLLPLLALAGPCLTSLGDPKPSFEAAHIATIPENLIPYSNIVWSPDGRRVAYAASTGQLAEVMEKELPIYPVIDEQVYKGFGDVVPPCFSSDSQHVVFGVAQNPGYFSDATTLLQDGELGEFQGWVGPVKFRPGTDQLVYWRNGGRLERDEWSGSVQGKQLVSEVPPSNTWLKVDTSNPIVFDAKGKVGLTCAFSESSWKILSITNKKTKVIGELGQSADLVISANGKQWAARLNVDKEPGYKPSKIHPEKESSFQIRAGKKWYGRQFDDVGKPAFSPQMNRVVYTYTLDSKVGIAVNNKPLTPASYAGILGIRFPKQGTDLAFIGVVSYGSRRGSALSWFGKKAKAKCHAIIANRRGEEVWRSEEFNSIDDITFAPNGQSIAFATRSEGLTRVHFGDQASEPFDQVGPLHFNPDGTKLAFGTRMGRSLDWTVMSLGPDKE